jgi:hypothetical protein
MSFFCDCKRNDRGMKPIGTVLKEDQRSPDPFLSWPTLAKIETTGGMRGVLLTRKSGISDTLAQAFPSRHGLEEFANG